MVKKVVEVVGDYSTAGSLRDVVPRNIRSGRFVVSSYTNVLEDEKSEISNTQSTVRILILRNNGKFLCVQNHEEKSKIGFPGGGIEPGETIEDAAVRELWEETGLIVEDLSLVDVDFFMDKRVFTFFASKYGGKLRSSQEGKTGWCSSETLTSGFYGEFYARLLKKLQYI